MRVATSGVLIHVVWAYLFTLRPWVTAYMVLSELLDLESHALSMIQLVSVSVIPSVELKSRLQMLAL